MSPLLLPLLQLLAPFRAVHPPRCRCHKNSVIHQPESSHSVTGSAHGEPPVPRMSKPPPFTFKSTLTCWAFHQSGQGFSNVQVARVKRTGSNNLSHLWVKAGIKTHQRINCCSECVSRRTIRLVVGGSKSVKCVLLSPCSPTNLQAANKSPFTEWPETSLIPTHEF